MPKFAYRGPSQIIDAFTPVLTEAGWMREGEFDAADLVVTYCVSASELEDLYFGEKGICQIANPSTAIIDMSPTTPNFASELNAVCTISDLQFIEAPLVCTNKVAKNPFAKENLKTFVACEVCDESLAFDFLNTCFEQVEQVGSPGSAQLLRAGVSLQSIAAMVSAIESYSLIDAARRSVSGLDVADLTPQGATPDAQLVLDAITKEEFESPFSIEMLMAELSSAIMAADDYELIIPQAEAAFHIIELLAVIGGTDKNAAAISLIYGNDKQLDSYGLDWSRAEDLFNHEHHDDEDEDDLYEDDYSDDYIDENFAEGAGFGYSVN